MDGDTGKLLDILPSRKKKDLVSYFMQFERRARLNVKILVTDMNASYASLIKRVLSSCQTRCGSLSHRQAPHSQF
nr:transposase [Enterococcus avium]